MVEKLKTTNDSKQNEIKRVIKMKENRFSIYCRKETLHVQNDDDFSLLIMMTAVKI